MTPAKTQPLTLSEARARLLEQYDAISRKNTHGAKKGKHDAWHIITTAKLAGEVSEHGERLLGPGKLRDLRLRELGEWLGEVVRTKNKGRKLEHLAECLASRTAPSQKHSLDYEFANALAEFLFGFHPSRYYALESEGKHSAAEADDAKGVVPTLADVRTKLGWDHKRMTEVSDRLGWTDLPHGRSGRPRKLTGAKSKKVG